MIFADNHKYSFVNIMGIVAIVIIGIGLSIRAAAQGVSINRTGAAAHSSAILDISDTQKGILLPRITKAQRDLISGASRGLLLYTIDDSIFNSFENTVWAQWLNTNVSSAAGGWSIFGSGSSDTSIHFIGSSDTSQVNLITNNQLRITMDSTGYTGIGQTSPKSSLHIGGYMQLDTIIGIPASADCDQPSEYGRMAIDPSSGVNAFWSCTQMGWVNIAQAKFDSTPSGTVAFFNLSSCPVGWSQYSAADGRMIMMEGTLGTESYNLGDTGGEARHTLTTSEMPSHSHSINPPSTTTSSAGNHSHSVDPPSTTTSTNGVHSHTVLDRYTSDSPGSHMAPDVPNELEFEYLNRTSSSNGNHAHSVDIGSFNSAANGSHNHSFNIGSFSSGSTGNGNSHENRPAYISLKACKKD